MPRKLALTCLAAVVALVSVGCAQNTESSTSTGADSDAAGGEATEAVLDVGDDEIRGSFSMVLMAHTTPYAGADLEEQEPNPWDGGTGEGPYRYASIPCKEDAPVNNISSDLPSFNTLIPGSRVPSSARAHPFEFDVAEGENGATELQGTLELTVCQLRPGVTPNPDPIPDPEKDRIRFEWTAQAEEASPESILWRGSFQIVGGTGPYEDLRGEGRIAGYFFCFAPEGCAELGEFRDAQFTLGGTYQVPAEAVDQAQTQPSEGADDTTGGGTDEATEQATEEQTEEVIDEEDQAPSEATEVQVEPSD